jgi:hypothetical protein
MLSGFQYKGTDLSLMIGSVSTIAQGNSGQYIKDSNTTDALSPYYNTLTNLSGPVSPQSIARLANDTKYTFIPVGDIKNSVIASYVNFPSSGVAQIPSWANSCSVFIIGGGGSGAGGSQGFNPSPGQKKSNQQGRGGGGGGGGGIIVCPKVDISQSTRVLQVTIGSGGAGTTNNQAGQVGGTSSITLQQSTAQQTAFPQSITPQFKVSGGGGGGGTVGDQNGGPPGQGGAGGNFFLTTLQVGNGAYGEIGQAGQNGWGQNGYSYVNGGSISSLSYSNKIPIQIISNGGSLQIQTQQFQQPTAGQVISTLTVTQGYGAGGPGGAPCDQGNTGPIGTSGGAGAPGFVRIYWLNTA